MSRQPDAPPYGAGTLAEVMPSAAAWLGVRDFTDSLGLGDGSAPDSVTVLLVDGLGWHAWQRLASDTPQLASMAIRDIRTTFPSTTPTALASLGTGLVPGEHGLLGAGFYLPEEGELLHPLSWESTPHPLAVQPEPTVFERVERAGMAMTRVGPRAYAESGLTRAGLRGGAYAGADTVEELVAAVGARRSGLTYAYTPDLDRIGHVFGVGSQEWLDSLREIDVLVERLLDVMDQAHALVVTADHGMVDSASTDRVSMDHLPGADDAIVAGEPRMRHVYVPPDRVPQIARTWTQELGDRAWVLTRREALSLGLFGQVSFDYAERVGDLVVIARGSTVLASATDPVVSGLIGQHGSLSDEEMTIPLLQARGRRGG